MTKPMSHFRFFVIVFCFCLFSAAVRAQDLSGDIFVGKGLGKGLDLGVDSSKHLQKWVRHDKTNGNLVLSYPADQEWAAVFITVGKASKDDRRYRDYSEFKTLSVEMKGLAGGEKVEVGIKTKDQADDGTETKIPVTLTAEWKTYQFSLDRFTGATAKQIYVVAEFVYTCAKEQTLQLRNIRYLKEEATRPETGDSPCQPSGDEAMDIIVGTKLSGGFGLGVDSSDHNNTWVSKKEGEFMIMSFPSDQDWSVAFVSVGPPSQKLKDGRQSKDLSAFKFLAIEMKGAVGKEVLEIGIKTNTQEDDGSEEKIPVTLTSEWKTYQFALERFAGAAPRKLYVVAEFSYGGSKPQTVFVRSIKYLKAARKESEK